MDDGNGIWDASAMDELRHLIREAVDAKKTTYKDLSIAIGKNHAYIQQFVERETPRELRERDARAIVELIQGLPPPAKPRPDARRVLRRRSCPASSSSAIATCRSLRPRKAATAM